MRRKISTFFRKKITIAKWQFNLFGLACFFVGTGWGIYLMVSGAFPKIFAATSPINFVLPGSGANEALFSAQGSSLDGLRINGTNSSEKIKMKLDPAIVSSDSNYVNSDYDVTKTDGLVGYWNMDDNTDNAAPGGATMKFNNYLFKNLDFTDGKINGGLAFSNGGTVSFDGGSAFNVNDNFSVETWVNPANCDMGYKQSTFFRKGTNYSLGMYGYYAGSGGWFPTCKFYVGRENDQIDVLSSATFAFDPYQGPPGWVHVAFTRSAGVTTIYINGSSSGSSSTPGFQLSSNSTVTMGDASGISNQTFPWSGKIDETRVYNKALTPAEIAAHYNSGIGQEGSNESNLVAGWHFNETAAPTFHDYSGNGFDINFPAPAYSAGKYGSKGISLSNDGSKALCTSVKNPITDPHGFSVGMWVNPGDTQTSDAIIATKDSWGWELKKRSDLGENKYSLVINQQYFNNDPSAYVELTPNVWQNLVVTFNDSGQYGNPQYISTISYYLNGSLVSQSAVGYYDWNLRSVVGSTCLGSNFAHDASTFFNGKIDEFSLYAKALSQQEIVDQISNYYRLNADTTWESSVVKLRPNVGWTADSFVANVDIPTGTSVDFKIRTGQTADNLGSYVDIDNGAYDDVNKKFTADLGGKNIPVLNRFVQVKAVLRTTLPKVSAEISKIEFKFLPDETPPSQEASETKVAVGSDGNGWNVVSGGWINQQYAGYSKFSWKNATDNESGIAGYCVYLGTDPNGNPMGIDPGNLLVGWWNTGNGASDKCLYFVAQDPSGKTSFTPTDNGLSYYDMNKAYYVNVKALNNSELAIPGAVDAGATVNFKVDQVAPNKIGFINAPGNFVDPTKIATTISWPTAGVDGANDQYDGVELSGVAGYQYKIVDDQGNGTWYGLKHNGKQDSSDLIPASTGSYTLQSQFLDENGNPIFVKDGNGDLILDENGNPQINSDLRSLKEGVNTLQMRVFDNAGNINDDSQMRATIKINTGSPSQPNELTVSPTGAKINLYAFSWKVPNDFAGKSSGANGSDLTYCYSINTLPSADSCIFTSADVCTFDDVHKTSSCNLPADSFANRPGENTFYLVAKDINGRINYETYASVNFSYDGDAPGIPSNVDIADISIKKTQNWKLAVSWEAPAQSGAGIDAYKIFRSETNTTCSSRPDSFESIGSTSGTSFADAGLSQKEYYYCVKACDSANNCSAYSATVSKLPTGKFTEPANMVGGPEVKNITTSKATISWTTDRNSDSRVSYGKSSDSFYPEEPSNSNQTTSHSIQLSNLNPGTTYRYKDKWTDEDGNVGISDEKSFQTDPAPVVSNVKAQDIGITNAFAHFTTNGASKAKIYYGTSTAFGSAKEIQTSNKESDYTFELPNLSDGTKYYYKINTFDSEGQEYEGTTLDFTTLPRPKISNVQIQAIKDSAQPGVQVTWDSNTEISSIVSYAPTNNATDKQNQVQVDLISGSHDATIMNLKPLTTYQLTVKGVDKAGNEAVSDAYSFTTASDTRPPVISQIVVEGSGSGNQTDKLSQLAVSWNTDETATSQVEFGEGVGTQYAQRTQEDANLTTNHLVILSGLTPSKVYHLRIISKDQASNVANSPDTVSITPKAVDSAFELVVGNLMQVFGFLKGIGN